MKQPTPEQVRALAVLENNPDWKTVRAWLKDWLADCDKANRKLLGEAMLRSQGTAQCLESLLEQADKAPHQFQSIRLKTAR